MSLSIESWRGKDYFIERYEQGRMMTNHVASLIQEKTRVEEEYQKKLEKIDKINSTKLFSENWTLGDGWTAMENFCLTEEKSRGEFCASLIDLTHSSNELKKEIHTTKFHLTNEMNKWERGKEKSHSEMVKSKQKHLSINHELEQARLLANKQSDESKKNIQNKIAKLEREQDQASKQDKASELNYNNFVLKYKQAINKILNSFVELDARRIICTRDLLAEFVKVNEKLQKSLEVNIQNLKSSVENIEERIDLLSWLKDGLSHNLFNSTQNYSTGGDSEPTLMETTETNVSPQREDQKDTAKLTLKKKMKLGLGKRPRSEQDPFQQSLHLVVQERYEHTPEPNYESPSEEDQNEADHKTKKKGGLVNLLDQVSSPRDRKPRRERREPETLNSPKSSTKGERKAIALYDYLAKDASEITLNRGDIITNVVDSNTSEDHRIKIPNPLWLYGEVHGKGGFFPLNFVEVFFPVGSKGIVEHDFLAEDEEELPLKTGEELTLISSSPDGWWRGKNEMGEIGLFPQNYVRLKETPQLQNPK